MTDNTTSVPSVTATADDIDALVKGILAEADKELNDEVIAKVKRRLKANAEDIRRTKKVLQNLGFERQTIIEELRAELAL